MAEPMAMTVVYGGATVMVNQKPVQVPPGEYVVQVYAMGSAEQVADALRSAVRTVEGWTGG